MTSLLLGFNSSSGSIPSTTKALFILLHRRILRGLDEIIANECAGKDNVAEEVVFTHEYMQQLQGVAACRTAAKN